MTFMPVSWDQICIHIPIWVRLINLGENNSQYVTSLLCASNSHMSRMSCNSCCTRGWFGSPLPITLVMTLLHSSQRSLRASHLGLQQDMLATPCLLSQAGRAPKHTFPVGRTWRKIKIPRESSAIPTECGMRSECSLVRCRRRRTCSRRKCWYR